MADYNSKYSGEQVEALLDQVASGNAGGGGGGGIAVETDPIFSNSPAATITEEKKAEWDGKQEAIADLATIRSGASKGATSVQPDDIEDFVKSSELADVAYTADYNELENKPTFKSINGESVVGSGNITIAGGSGEKGEKGDKGDTGVGVQSVKQTTTSNVDSGYNVVTVTLTDGTTSTFSVKNGSKGSTGANGKDGADGEDGATFTPSVDSAGNLSWTNNKGLTNPPTVNIKGPKGDKGDAGEGGGGSSDLGKQEIVWANPGITTMRPNVIYWIEGSPHLEIFDFEPAPDEVDSYDVFTVVAKLEPLAGNATSGSLYITIPEYVRWANGQVPEIPTNAKEFSFELSISRMSDGYGYDIYNAVLTPFKHVE